MKNSNEKDACQPWVKVYRVVHVETGSTTEQVAPGEAERRADEITGSGFGINLVIHDSMLLPATSTPTCGATPTSEAEAAKRREDVNL
uniref:Uncharacterized protein n=1 Tax=Oryza meridionalis TaxID=40149 RepID=A0A0E0DF11_9ORYZ